MTSEAGWAPDALDDDAFGALVAPLFEAAPRFIGRLTKGRPYGSWEELFRRGEILALDMPRDEQLELIDAHPPIGAPPGSVSSHSFVEQGYDVEAASSQAESERRRIQAELDRLNAAYEARFGFRYVVYVAGRPRSAIVPLIEAALEADADPDVELGRALRDVLAIARDRAIRSGLMEAEADGNGMSGADVEEAAS